MLLHNKKTSIYSDNYSARNGHIILTRTQTNVDVYKRASPYTKTYHA